MPQAQTTTAIVAANVRRIADAKRINQTTLGAALGFSQSAMSRRLLGRRAFSLDELDQLAHILDVPLAALLAAS